MHLNKNIAVLFELEKIICIWIEIWKSNLHEFYLAECMYIWSQNVYLDPTLILIDIVF